MPSTAAPGRGNPVAVRGQRPVLPSPDTICILSSLSWGGGSSRGILVVFLKLRDPEMCTFRVLGWSCETQTTLGPYRDDRQSRAWRELIHDTTILHHLHVIFAVVRKNLDPVLLVVMKCVSKCKIFQFRLGLVWSMFKDEKWNQKCNECHTGIATCFLCLTDERFSRTSHYDMRQKLWLDLTPFSFCYHRKDERYKKRTSLTNYSSSVKSMQRFWIFVSVRWISSCPSCQSRDLMFHWRSCNPWSQIVTNGFYAWSNFEFVQFFFSLTFVSEDDIMRHSFRTKIEFERRSFFKYSVFRVRFPTRDEALSECSCCGRGPWCHKCQLSPKVHLEEDRWVVPRTTFDPSSSRDRLESIVVFNFICGWRVRGSQVTKVQVFLRRMTPECCVSTLESNVLGYWDGPKQFSWWPHRFMRGKWRDTCVLGVRWTSSHHQRGWRCQRKQMLSCRAARQQAPGVGTCRDGTRIQRKVHSSQSQPKGSHRRRSLANVERFQKDDVQLLEFWTVAVGPGWRWAFETWTQPKRCVTCGSVCAATWQPAPALAE